jgi:hypothetical protein
MPAFFRPFYRSKPTLKQRITLGIAYSKLPSTNSGVTLSNMIIRPSGNGFEISCNPSLPSGRQLDAAFTYGAAFPANAPIIRDMPGDTLRISWKTPEGFYLNNLATVSPFVHGIDSGHVIFSSESFELFALTNRDDPGKVWRGLLKVRRVDPDK